MPAYISIEQAAKRLGISTADIAKLVEQEILKPKNEPPDGQYLFADSDIESIASNRDPTLSEEAAQVGIQIQQEVAYSVSALQKLWRRLGMVAGVAAVFLIVSVVLMAALFRLYPRQTSDFFGYYYRFNAGGKSAIYDLGGADFSLVGSTTVPAITSDTSTSLAASITKPIAAASLLLVKATDDNKYKQIVQPPTAVLNSGSTGSTGQPGASGVNGVNGRFGLSGVNGQPGATGAAGAAGAAGIVGANGINGTGGVNGANGVNGTDGINGTNGIDGVNGADGINGTNGIDGLNGINGADGIDGTSGTNGIDGTNGVDGINGTNGIDGTSVADVTTTPGDIIIRDAGNVTTRLGAGSDGQVLTVSGGIPAWMDASGLTAESDTLASVTARGATTSANLIFSGGLTFSGAITLSGLANCPVLATNGSGVLQCGSPASNPNSAVAFTDSTPATIADNDTTELFNDPTKPSITPNSTGQTVLVSVHARFTGGNTDAAVRIVRHVGSAASCSSGTQVGDTFSAYLKSANDIQNASGTFLDSPATTSAVYYTVCSSANSKLGSIPASNRIDVTLLRIGG